MWIFLYEGRKRRILQLLHAEASVCWVNLFFLIHVVVTANQMIKKGLIGGSVFKKEEAQTGVCEVAFIKLHSKKLTAIIWFI